MQQKQFLINLGKPMVLLNGLVTDKNNYTDEQKLQLLQSNKKIKLPKHPKITYHSTENQEKNKDMDLSEDEDSDNGVKIISSLNNPSSKNNQEKKNDDDNKMIEDNIKDDINIIQNFKKEEMMSSSNESKNSVIFNTHIDIGMKKKKKNTNSNTNTNKTVIKKSHKSKKDENNIPINDFSYDNNSDNPNVIGENSIDVKNKRVKRTSKKKLFSQRKEEISQIKVEYKNVPKANTYEEIMEKSKKNSCVCIDLLDYDDLKGVVEEKSETFKGNKKLKKDKKENVIYSGKKSEIKLTKSIYYLLKLKGKRDLFNMLSPENNNILQFMPQHITGINNYGYLNINYCINNNTGSNNTINKDEEEIHFINKFFTDKNNQQELLFRKYILNLSAFKSNETLNNDNDFNIYHIIIPKKSVAKIDINFEEEITIKSLIQKLDCEYYFYCQRPGELLIVEPESILLSFCSKKNNNGVMHEKNYLLMYWNKMNVESFSDYITLQNICKKENYKLFPIVNTLIKLLNTQSDILKDDFIKIILEIYNNMDSCENINNYINEISNNNIRFHKLYLNNIYLCRNCGQEIFNFYVYDQNYNNKELNYNNLCDINMALEEENDNDNINNYNQNDYKFICINCAHNKNYFKVEKNIIFFKYTKEEINNFLSSVSSRIGQSRNKNEIISHIFDKNRENDCINVDEFILKIDGPLRILDSEFEKNNNNLLNKEIKVDKYLKILGDNYNDKNKDDVEPLNPKNFKNNKNKDDIYEKLGLNQAYVTNVSFGLSDSNIRMNNQENRNNRNNVIDMNANSFGSNNFFNKNSNNMKINPIIIKDEQKEKEEVKNVPNRGSRKNKKKNGTNLQDMIFSGEF